MKNLLLLLGFVAILVSCGPSAEQVAAEQARLDSLKQDSIAKVEAEALRIQDSIANAQALADTLAVDTLAVE